MELLIELVIEFLFEGGFEIIASNSPKGVRIAVLGIMSVVYAGLIALFVYLCVICESVILSVVLGIVSAAILGLFIRLWYKVIKNKPFKNEM